MNLDKLYELTEKENIPVYNWYVDDSKGFYMEYKGSNYIALNYDNINTTAEEKCTLSEELGHYYTGSIYPASCNDKNYISKQEYKAKKYSYNILVPYESLKKACKTGLDTSYQLADYFEVTEEYMQNCINFYTNKYGGIYV